MSVKIAVRLPDEMHTKISQIASESDRTVSAVILEALDAGLIHGYAGQGIALPTITPAIRKAHQVASPVSNVTTAAQLPPQHNYERPKHAESCHCYSCRPPAA